MKIADNICLRVAVLAGLLSLAVSGCKDETHEKVIIGAILPLTGPIAIDGEELLVGVRIAQKDADSLYDGKYQLVVEDGQFDSKKSVLAYRKLKAKGLDALLVAGDGPTEAVSTFVNRDNIVAMSPLTGSMDLKKCSSNIFRAWFYVPNVSCAAASFLQVCAGITNTAVFYNDTLYGRLSQESFKHAFRGKHGVVSAAESYPFLATSLRSEIAKIMAKEPHAIYVTGFGLGFSTAINQIVEADYSGMVITDNALADAMILKSLKKPKDIHFVDLAFSKMVADGNAESVAFVSKYEKETGRRTPTNQALLAYEAMMSLMRNYSNDRAIMRSLIIKDKSRGQGSLIGGINFSDDGEAHFPLLVKKYDSEGEAVVVFENPE